MRQESVGWCLVLLVVAQVALPALALPEGRKFAVKPNAIKKVIAEKNEITVIILLWSNENQSKFKCKQMLVALSDNSTEFSSFWDSLAH